jgi:hypothetical protein
MGATTSMSVTVNDLAIRGHLNYGLPYLIDLGITNLSWI